MQGTGPKRIRIIGAGIAGLSAGWAFQRAGCEVSIADCGPIPNPAGGSFDHSRLIHPFPADSEAAPRRLKRSLAAWELVWEAIGERLHRLCGALTVLPLGGPEPDELLSNLARAGIGAEALSGGELARRLPGIDLPRSAVALLHPEGGILLARAILAALQALIRAEGGAFEAGSAVEPHALAALADEADATILACGAWSGGLLASLSPELARSLTPIRQVMLYLSPPADRSESWARSAAFVGLGDGDELWGVPPLDGEPLKLAVGALARPVDSPRADARPSEPEIAAILSRFAPLLPELDRYRLIEARACHYTRATGDGWITSRLRRGSGRLWFFGGCNGSGFKSAPAAALELAEKVLAQRR